MKKLLFALLVLCSFNASSQTSFKMKVDTSVKVKYIPEGQIVVCADGGIAISAASIDYYSFLMKYDSSGIFQWSKICQDNLADLSVRGIQLLATSDSGFYMKTEDQPDMFGWFGDPVIQKFNKFGDVEHTGTMFVTPPLWNPLQGNNLNLLKVEKRNNNLHGLGFASFYDGVNDQICCLVGYEYILDSTLTLVKKRTGYLMYDSLDVPFTVDYVGGVTNQQYGLSKCDTSGLQFGTNFYKCDTTVMKFNSIRSVCQDKKNIYLLHFIQFGSNLQLGLQKTDLNLNTEFMMVLDTTFTLPSASKWKNIEMDKSETGNLLISAIIQVSSSSKIPIMMEIDSTGIVHHVWKGDGSDSLYVDNAIDTTNQAILFLSSQINGSFIYRNYEFQKEYPSAPSCNFIPLTINPYFVTIADSAVNDSLTPITPVEPQYNNFFSQAIPLLTAATTSPICGVFSGFNETDDNKCLISAYPNPAGDFIDLNLNCHISMIETIKIYNMVGSDIFVTATTASANEIALDTRMLPDGIYLINLYFKDGRIGSRKIVIQH